MTLDKEELGLKQLDTWNSALLGKKLVRIMLTLHAL